MINGKSILGIIPARGGSKGIPRKNIKLLAGKPLIAWTIEEAKKSKYIDRLILSSEDEEIIRVSKEWGCEVPFIRPRDLAKDETPGIEPVFHAIENLKEDYDYICLLQPTSPLRIARNIDECIQKCIENNTDSCVSVSKVEKHPYWMFEMNNNGILSPLFKDIFITQRQDLPVVYALNGAIYVASTKQIMEQNKFVCESTIGYKMPSEYSIDIDNPIDFQIAQFLLNKKYES